MNAKTIAVIAIFASLTIVLNLSPLKIPAPYATYLIYQIWEIPIIAAFLLYGILVGFMIALLNTLILLAVFPGELPTGPLYNFAAALSMLLGVLIAKKLAKSYSPKHGEAFLTTLFTIFGITTRVLIMSFVNYTFLRFPPPVGFNMPEEAIIISLPLIAIFNGTLALYTIPLGYYLAKTTKIIIKTEEP